MGGSVVADLLFGVLPVGCGGLLFVFVLLCITMCPFLFCNHLEEEERADCFAFIVLRMSAGKGLTSWLSFVVSTVSLSLSYWYPGSVVVLDCIDS